jgi:D-alanyl-lipoteichoic acid acyltransferase DltB (MBOAT superfamily)
LLFNSYPFLLGFFPAVLALYFLAARFGDRARLFVILAASLFFYGWWDVRFLALLLGSILTNFALSGRLAGAVARGDTRHANYWTAFGVTLNLVVLGVFKYAHFFVANLNAVAGTDFNLIAIVLPLGISFFTFEQIAFLVDLRRGQKWRPDLLKFALFVSFFPRLVAGPILRYREIEPQLDFAMRARPMGSDLAGGLSIFFIGLFKKAFLADGIAPYATGIFGAAASGQHVDFLIAWGGVLAYTAQLYFDFSGYSDMAIGAARCFGIRFPMNFASPYKATSIVEFWRCWHITLSRFLRDYLYIPLGGSRRGGKLRRYINLMITMLLGGLWHGANWTFVCWGGLHGLYLMINHAWGGIAERSTALTKLRGTWCFALGAWALTFLAVVIAWVFFRAPNFTAALDLLASMSGAHGIVIPTGLAFALQPAHDLLVRLGITFADTSGAQLIDTYLWVAALLALAFLAPSTQEIFARLGPVLEMPEQPDAHPRRFAWVPNAGWAMATGLIASIGIMSVTRLSEFLYWQF